MSAVNVLLGDKRVDLVCDGAATMPRGNRLLSVALKCVPLPHLNCVVALRGRVGAMRWLMAFLPRFPSIEDMTAGFAVSA